MANTTKKATYHQVNFKWGRDAYCNTERGIINATINVMDAADKFDALNQAWIMVQELANHVEPREMNCESREMS